MTRRAISLSEARSLFKGEPRLNTGMRMRHLINAVNRGLLLDHDGPIITDVDDGGLDTQCVLFSKDQIRSIYVCALPPKVRR